MAKHLGSRYLPGQRSSGWLKIKPTRRLPCVIIGWHRGVYGLRGLLVGAPWNGRLRYVANVRTGFTDHDRQRLPEVLGGRERSRPVVPCPQRGLWVQPEILCQINYLEWTRAGRARDNVFHSGCVARNRHRISISDLFCGANCEVPSVCLFPSKTYVGKSLSPSDHVESPLFLVGNFFFTDFSTIS